MSLRDAVEEVVQQMESEQVEITSSSDPMTNKYFGGVLRTFIRELKLALKASEGAVPITAAPSPFLSEAQASARAMAFDRLKRAERDDAGEARMVECVGGSSGGVMAPLAGGAPVGAKTLISGEVYVLKDDGRLHFSAAETVKVRGGKAGS